MADGIQVAVDVEGDGGGGIVRGAEDAVHAVVFVVNERRDLEVFFVELRVGHDCGGKGERM